MLQGVLRSDGSQPTPVLDAEVCLTDTAFSGVPLVNEARCTGTDSAGRFAFEGLDCARQYSLMAHAPGYAAATRVVPAATECRERAAELLLIPAASESTGVVLDAAGGSIGGALVSAHLEPTNELVGFTRSNADGRFRLAAREGLLEMRVEGDGYSMQRRRVAAPADGLTFTLVPASAIRGRVLVEGSGSPLSGVLVEARNWNGLQEPLRSVLTREDGSFELDRLPAGGYELRALGDAWRSPALRVGVGVAENVPDVVLTAQAGASLTGTVEVGGKPCRDGLVTLEGAQSAWRRIVNGEVQFLGLSPGRYSVDIRCSRRFGPRLAVDVGADDVDASSNDELQLDLGRAQRSWALEPSEPQPDRGTAQLRVSLIGPPDEIAALEVRALQGLEPPLWGVRQGATTLFSDLRLGSYHVYLEAAPESHATILLERAGQTVDLTLRAPHRRSIAGRVLDEHGEPIAEAWVTASIADAPPEERRGVGIPVLTNGQGEFAIEGLFASAYDLSVSFAGGQGELHGVAAGATDVALTVPRRTALASSVHGTGEPLE